MKWLFLNARFFFCCITFFSSYAFDTKILKYIDYAKKNLLVSQGSNRIFKTFFCPDKEPNAKEILLGLIENEERAIFLAQYVITADDILDALIRAKKRGVIVSVITDKASLEQKKEKISRLKRAKIEVNIYNKHYSIMHHKFFIFIRNLCEKPVVWVGSANCTFSAFSRNKESIVVFNEKTGVQSFYNHFLNLRKELLSKKTIKTRAYYFGIYQRYKEAKKIE